MWFKSLMNRVPYIGNLVRTKYLVLNSMSDCLNKVMPCWSVRVDPANAVPGIILTDSDLAEAHLRYVKYFELMTDEMKEQDLGTVSQRVFLTKRSGGKNEVELLLAYFVQNGERIGYLFAVSDMIRIVERSKKLEQTVRFPNRFQDVLIWLNVKLGHLKREES